MYYINVKGEFSGAHRIRNYNGKCEKLHGHNWEVEVFFTNKKLDNRGILFDFKEAKYALRNVLAYFDHKFLNELPEFRKLNPSAENIAHVIAKALQKEIKKKSKVVKVIVWETNQTSAVYVVNGEKL